MSPEWPDGVSAQRRRARSSAGGPAAGFAGDREGVGRAPVPCARKAFEASRAWIQAPRGTARHVASAPVGLVGRAPQAGDRAAEAGRGRGASASPVITRMAALSRREVLLSILVIALALSASLYARVARKRTAAPRTRSSGAARGSPSQGVESPRRLDGAPALMLPRAPRRAAPTADEGSPSGGSVAHGPELEHSRASVHSSAGAHSCPPPRSRAAWDGSAVQVCESAASGRLKSPSRPPQRRGTDVLGQPRMRKTGPEGDHARHLIARGETREATRAPPENPVV